MTTDGITETKETTIMVENIKRDMINFVVDAEKVDNKSAARRARKLSMEIGRQLKEYRAKSIK